MLHAKPAPRVPTDPRFPPPAPSTLARLGRRASPVPDPKAFSSDDEITETKRSLFQKHLRTCSELPAEDLRLVHALALRLLARAEDSGGR